MSSIRITITVSELRMLADRLGALAEELDQPWVARHDEAAKLQARALYLYERADRREWRERSA